MATREPGAGGAAAAGRRRGAAEARRWLDLGAEYSVLDWQKATVTNYFGAGEVLPYPQKDDWTLGQKRARNLRFGMEARLPLRAWLLHFRAGWSLDRQLYADAADRAVQITGYAAGLGCDMSDYLTLEIAFQRQKSAWPEEGFIIDTPPAVATHFRADVFFLSLDLPLRPHFQRVAPWPQAIALAARLLGAARHVTVFSGAGISVESGIPPFRGPGGLWSRVDPGFIEIDYFLAHPEEVLAEDQGDLLRLPGGSRAQRRPPRRRRHGKSGAGEGGHHPEHRRPAPARRQPRGDRVPRQLPLAGLPGVPAARGGAPRAAEVPAAALLACGGLLKPDFIFFGEGIPEKALQRSYQEASQADLFLVIGSSGEVQPACQIPPLAKARGAKLIEINPHESNFTPIADVFLQGPATEIVSSLVKEIGL